MVECLVWDQDAAGSSPVSPTTIKKIMTNKLEVILEWSSTVILLIGVALTSFNVFPLNLWVCLIANAGWGIVGIVWHKWSLFLVQIVVTALYLAGIYKHYMI